LDEVRFIPGASLSKGGTLRKGKLKSVPKLSRATTFASKSFAANCALTTAARSS
jgi:hypothetical protein